MWATLTRQQQLYAIVSLTTIVLLGLQGLSELWSSEKASLLKSISSVVFILGTILVFVFNRYWRALWAKFPALNRAIFPDLNGEWVGTLNTTWKDPETGLAPGPISARLTIEQSLFDISVRQETEESTSYSSRVVPETRRDADLYRIWFSYTNRPQAKVSHRSSQHDGFGWLEISLKRNAGNLTGQYFTSRLTSGDMMFQKEI